MKGNHWPAERMERLKALYAEGLTMEVIASTLNAAEPGLTMTRSSIGGMVSRLIKKAGGPLARAPKETGWTPDRVARLRIMWEQGQSAAQIAVEVGFTRSAVLGKLKRLYKAGKPVRAVSAQKPRRTMPTGGNGRFVLPRQKHNGGRHAHLAAVVQNNAAKLTPHEGYTARAGAFEPLPGTEPQALLERPFLGCAWPVGGEGADTLFCCAPKDGGSYCAAHASIGFTASAPAPSAKEWFPAQRRRAA